MDGTFNHERTEKGKSKLEKRKAEEISHAEAQSREEEKGGRWKLEERSWNRKTKLGMREGSMSDAYDLRRFVEAHEGVYEDAVDPSTAGGRLRVNESRAGRKRSHWMWFVFPQLRGLGRSPMAERYGIGSVEEAKAYASDAVLGPRLRDCTRLVVEVEGRSVGQIFGYPESEKE